MPLLDKAFLVQAFRQRRPAAAAMWHCCDQWQLTHTSTAPSRGVRICSLQIVPEPVEQWQNVGGQGGNMLDHFYKNPQRYAYTFQNYVFITRVMQVHPVFCVLVWALCLLPLCTTPYQLTAPQASA